MAAERENPKVSLLRELLRTMDDSIDEARRRRLGLPPVQMPSATSTMVGGKLKATRVPRERNDASGR